MGNHLYTFMGVFAFSTLGNLLMKIGAHTDYSRLLGPFSWLSMVGLACLAGGSVFYAKALQNLPLYFAYSMLAAQYILIMMAAWIFLGESISIGKWIGSGFIVLGLFCINRF